MAERVDRDSLTEILQEFESLSPEIKESKFMSAISLLSSDGKETGEDQLWDALRIHALNALCDGTPALRRVAANFMGRLCGAQNIQVYIDSKQYIYHQIVNLINRDKFSKETDLTSTEQPNGDISNHNLEVYISPDDFQQQPVSQTAGCVTKCFRKVPDTSNWKHLDSWFFCIEEMARGCGSSFSEQVDIELLDFISYCLNCNDRYLQLACMKLLCTLLNDCEFHKFLKDQKAFTTSDQKNISDVINQTEKLFFELITQGISHLNPEVRRQSITAIKSLLLSSVLDGNIEFADPELLKTFLPPLCYNRYHSEAGLQRFCQETWVELTQGQGRKLMENFSEGALSYYVHHLTDPLASNAVMACHCISEVVRKLDKGRVSLKIGNLYAILKPVAQKAEISMNSSVMEAVYLLYADLIENYTEQMSPYLEEMKELVSDILEHPNDRVRECSTTLYCTIVKSYDPERSGLEEMLIRIKNCFKEACRQSKEEKLADQATTLNEPKMNISVPDRDGGLGGNQITVGGEEQRRVVGSPQATWSGTVFRIEKRSLEGNDDPKSGFVFIKLGGNTAANSFPEVSYIPYSYFHLLCSLSSVTPKSHLPKVSSLLPDLSSLLSSILCQGNHYNLVGTFLERLPELFNNLGKDQLKRYLDFFLGAVIEVAGQSTDPVAREASVACLNKFAESLGRSILEGRVRSQDPAFAERFFKG